MVFPDDSAREDKSVQVSLYWTDPQVAHTAAPILQIVFTRVSKLLVYVHRTVTVLDGKVLSGLSPSNFEEIWQKKINKLLTLTDVKFYIVVQGLCESFQKSKWWRQFYSMWLCSEIFWNIQLSLSHCPTTYRTTHLVQSTRQWCCPVSSYQSTVLLEDGLLSPHKLSHLRWSKIVYYETIKRELNKRLIYECRCDERLKAKTERSTCLAYTVLRGGQWSSTIVDLTRKKKKVMEHTRREVKEENVSCSGLCPWWGCWRCSGLCPFRRREVKEEKCFMLCCSWLCWSTPESVQKYNHMIRLGGFKFTTFDRIWTCSGHPHRFCSHI